MGLLAWNIYEAIVDVEHGHRYGWPGIYTKGLLVLNIDSGVVCLEHRQMIVGLEHRRRDCWSRT